MLCQDYSFGWIKNPEVSLTESDNDLDSLVANINSNPGIKFVLISGDITKNGKPDEFRKAKVIFDKLYASYYIIPGNGDARQTNSGLIEFLELWKSDKFSIKFDSTQIIGFNSSRIWQEGSGHITPEDLKWLKSEINNASKNKSEILLLSHFPLNSSIDNWFKVTNLLVNKKSIAVLTAEGQNYQVVNHSGVPGITGRSFRNQNDESWGYNVIRNVKDSLQFFELNKNEIPLLKSVILKRSISPVHSEISDEIQDLNCKLLWKHDLQYSLLAPIRYSNGSIFAVDKAGLITCLSSSGRVKWENDLFGDVAGGFDIQDNIIAVGTLQGDLISLKESNGEIVQSIGFNSSITTDLKIFNFSGFKDLMIPKTTNSNAAVILGTGKGDVFCYDLETLQEIWKSQLTKERIVSRPLYSENKIFFNNKDGVIYSINSSDGLLIWKWRENPPINNSTSGFISVTDGNAIYLTSGGKPLYKLDLLLGKTIWKSDKYNSGKSIALSTDKKILYVKSASNNFYSVNPDDGKKLNEFNLDFGMDDWPTEIIEYENRILFGSRKGFVYQIKENKMAEPVLFMGTALVHSLVSLGNNKFAAANNDGLIVVFELN